MADRDPFDMAQWMRLFDPEQMARMWTPQTMMGAMQPKSTSVFDMSQVMESNRRNFEAMAEANKAAAQTYKDLLDKQMEIFERMTKAVRSQADWAEDSAGMSAMNEKTAEMNTAVEEALALMKKLADATREANAEAYQQVKVQVDEAVEGLKKAGD